ncbi:MAG: class I SAM-dependent methyltransferase [Parvularculales bacterium]
MPDTALSTRASIDRIFERAASHYDVMNDLMSGGVHRLWKTMMLDWLAPPRNDTPFHLLDMAGGTGDIALGCLDRAGEGTFVTLCDINLVMLEAGHQRFSAGGPYKPQLHNRLQIGCANAEALPFPDKSFDAYTIAFGLRNMEHREQALGEAFRVLRSGGRFLCLEFSPMVMPGLKELYDAWSFWGIPTLGQIVASEDGPWRYLVESIRQFPDRETLVRNLEETGFLQIKVRPLTGGIAVLHSGWRL